MTPRSRRTYSPPQPSLAWTAFILGACLASIIVALVLLFSPRHAGIPRQVLPGVFCLLMTLYLGGQLAWTTRKGFVSWWRTQAVSKASRTPMYRIWFIIHLLVIVMFGLFAAILLR